jgi:hypothetical protein
MSRPFALLVLISGILLMLGMPAAIAAKDCAVVNGSASVVFDPTVGGFVGPVDLDGDGAPDATSTATVLTIVPSEDGTLHAVTSHVVVLNSGAMFTTLDRAILSPSDTPGLYRLNTDAPITSGASGKLKIHGNVHLIEGWAELDVHGRICGLAI